MDIIEIIMVCMVFLSGAVVDVEPEIVEMPEIVTQQEMVETTTVTTDELEITLNWTKPTYPEHWTCYDFAMNYSEQHPEWGMVVISDNSRFQGMNHIVNYKINDDKSLQIISYMKQDDGYEVIKYVMRGEWWYDPVKFYHFYLDGEVPTRNYKHLMCNVEEVYNEF